MIKEQKKKTKKISKAKLLAIITASIVILLAVALIITNIFIPVKYLASYCVKGNRAKVGNMRVSFLDVGYGDCIIVELPDGKNMLIDAGNGSYTNNSTVLKELNKRGINTIDYLICSSVNSEHCGGLSEILKYKKVKTVYMPYCKNKYVTDAFCDFYDQTRKCGAEIIYSEYKAGVNGEDYFFTFLSPSVIDFDGGEYSQLNTNPSLTTRNNSSAVMWLEYADSSFIFTSDVEASILNAIVNSYNISADDYLVKLENCNVVQVANHGIEKSACVGFYDLISPQAAVISVGENGSGSPSIKTLSDVINSVGESLYRTDEHGSVVFEVTATGYTIK